MFCMAKGLITVIYW
uniref:Uncharacterized protein n=1 Tax=Arundo donax TaxID=35708 RepID=A0A0A9AH69_ARUDO